MVSGSNRTKPRSVIHNIYNEARQLIAQYEKVGTGSLTWKRDIVYVGTKELAEVDATGTEVTFVDHLGSPRFAWRGGTTPVIKQKFLPFGEQLTDPTTAKSFAKGFTNHEQTDPSGLIYMQARFYAPWFGRFLSPDPGLDQHFQETQSWNIYSYVKNNPITHIDPNGLADVVIWKFTGLIKGNMGHAAMSLNSGTYMSWWPQGEGRMSIRALGIPAIPGIPIYSSLAIEDDTFESNQELEDTDPEIIHLDSLDESRIESWWKNDWKKDPYWRTLSRNCSTLVASALRVGFTGTVPKQWASKRIWTPRDVRDFANWIRIYEKYVKPNIGKIEPAPVPTIAPKKETISPLPPRTTPPPKKPEAKK